LEIFLDIFLDLISSYKKEDLFMKQCGLAPSVDLQVTFQLVLNTALYFHLEEFVDAAI
jgi:hypothetical protein